MHHEFEWPIPENKGEADTLRHIREFGCSNISIPWGGTEKEPPFTYSVGLFANYDHPELIMFGLDNASAIINEIRDHVAAGRKFADGDIADDIMANDYKVCFWRVPLMVYPRYLGVALWVYDKCPTVFPCLQVIWQDANRRFPWEAECEEDVKVDQPLLKKMVS
jgi:uncharacterized protein DUF4262